jgi:hypothetical protein
VRVASDLLSRWRGRGGTGYARTELQAKFPHPSA